MRLSSIKLSGFKSFVDSTTVSLPTNLTAIVGPNGCGKSNIIDAVRWVMGESSAKQLRGESLDDVIFNGSIARKPVGQAAIELAFDNSDHTLLGQYASYSEIVIRREISRDGQSNYYLNNTRCRRKDIIDVFLGTGLGPRSYAIIEQGTISKVIEAKPEELRNFIEEAAGISKYKERRHETELRIRHTEENLARLNDIREELEKQLNHLQRQASAAEKYKVLKQEERELRGKILAIRWKIFNTQALEQREIIADYETQLEGKMGALHELETILETQRELQEQVLEKRQTVQEQFYQISNDVSQIQQAIKHHNDRLQQWHNESKQIHQTLETNQQQLRDNSQQSEELTIRLDSLQPEIEAGQLVAADSKAKLAAAEQAIQTWQIEWENFNREAAQTNQQIQVAQTRIQHLEQHIQTVSSRLERLQSEHEQHQLELTIEPAEDFIQKLSDLKIEHETVQSSLQDALQAISDQREMNNQTVAELDEFKNQTQALRGKHASLIALQEAALGRREEVVSEWLKQNNLYSLPRLAEVIQVEQGWEKAVEAVLETQLQAVCLENLDSDTLNFAELPQANISLVAKAAAPSNSKHVVLSTLLSKVQGDWPLSSLLDGIYLAETNEQAQQYLPSLTAHESIVTRDGVWMGSNWMYVAHKADATSGVIQRERELTALKATIDDLETQIQIYTQKLSDGQTRLHQLEHERELLQRKSADLVSKQADVRAAEQVRSARHAQLSQRREQIAIEIQDAQNQLQDDKEALAQVMDDKQIAVMQVEEQIQQRETLLQVKSQQQTSLDELRQKAQSDQEAVHQLALQRQANSLQLENLKQNAARIQQQMVDLEERQTLLQAQIEESELPLLDMQERQEQLSEQRSVFEAQLLEVTGELDKIAQQVKDAEFKRHSYDENLAEIRNNLEQSRLQGQTIQVRSKSIEEQAQEMAYVLEEILSQLQEEYEISELEETFNQVVRKIERLGAINLAAIDECAALVVRKEYLDNQYNDLFEALTTLQDAIRTMDKETRTRFKETYDKVNENFQKLFPSLFGGGKATLEIGDEDILTAGVSVIAQPPGKRNSSIHLLSGGEKALTAVALVFSLFQLNPAPFCMLDEVDAPLDDANVIRFCNLVKEMSAQVQFIFISHNKLAIEMAKQLTGVTMQEAGVSRMVAVDVEEAIALAAA